MFNLSLESFFKFFYGRNCLVYKSDSNFKLNLRSYCQSSQAGSRFCDSNWSEFLGTPTGVWTLPVKYQSSGVGGRGSLRNNIQSLAYQQIIHRKKETIRQAPVRISMIISVGLSRWAIISLASKQETSPVVCPFYHMHRTLALKEQRYICTENKKKQKSQ